MITNLSNDASELARRAARSGAQAIRQAIAGRGEAFVILATGASQLKMLECLIAEPGIAWSRVTAFHLDEYIAMPETHNASFRRYLKSRFLAHVKDLREFVLIEGDASDLEAEIARVSKRISEHDIDVAFVGIGENAHLAFNDPPADFDTTQPYIVVDLDEKCRRQQLGEGWFADLSEVPTRAISMSVRQIMSSKTLICTVPDARKAEAVKCALQGPVSNLCPASILQTHDHTYIFLDRDSASQLDEPYLASATTEEPA